MVHKLKKSERRQGGGSRSFCVNFESPSPKTTPAVSDTLAVLPFPRMLFALTHMGAREPVETGDLVGTRSWAGVCRVTLGSASWHGGERVFK